MSDNTYFKRWYEKNKDRLAAKRRFRYKTDPEYRKKVKEQAERSRKKREPKVRLSVNPHRAVIDGKVYITVRGLAQMTGRSRYSIYFWIREGFFPPPVSVNDSTLTYYTLNQAVAIRDGLRLFISGKRKKEEEIEKFQSYIMKRWDDGRKEAPEAVDRNSESIRSSSDSQGRGGDSSNQNSVEGGENNRRK